MLGGGEHFEDVAGGHQETTRTVQQCLNASNTDCPRTVVGTLLYLTRPDICNPVRKLSKTMGAPAPVHLKEMYKLIRFVLSTKDYGLKFELRKDMKKWALKELSDSDFASDKETRITVFGYIIYFCGIPIAWRSKGMKGVVLSITEAEYMALSEVVKELKFIVQLLQTMNIEENYTSQFMWTMLEQSGYQTTGQPVIEQSTLISELLL